MRACFRLTAILKVGLALGVLWGSGAYAGEDKPRQGTCQVPVGETSAAALQSAVYEFQVLAEDTLSRRASAITFLAELKEKEAAGEPLSGQDLRTLNQGYADMLAIRDRLWQASTQHECWLNWTPTTAADEVVRQTGLTMSLAAALTLYDNYLTAISMYRADGSLRRLMNKRDAGFEIKRHELDKIYLSAISPLNRQRIRTGLQWFDSKRDKALAGAPEGYGYLVALVEQSQAAPLLRKFDPVGVTGKLAHYATTLGMDTVAGTTATMTFLPSYIFGNAVGLVETRRGKLFNNPTVTQDAKAGLTAGDILLEKTPFRLTDRFIPGHWGHAAIWVGSADELKALGIWNNPVVVPYQKQILAGKGVVEALRSGVKMNTLEHFLNVDDLAVLQQPGLDDAGRADVILQTLRQVGKAYDFNFDVETTDKIVCSELVYHAYGHVKWPTSKVMGHVTISPDDIAKNTLNGLLTPTVIYHNGLKVEDRLAFMPKILVGNP